MKKAEKYDKITKIFKKTQRKIKNEVPTWLIQKT